MNPAVSAQFIKQGEKRKEDFVFARIEKRNEMLVLYIHDESRSMQKSCCVKGQKEYRCIVKYRIFVC